jgi:hypothetical protein
MFLLYLGTIGVKGTERVWLGGGGQNGPKQRQTRRLGSRYVIFFFRVIANVFILLMY